MRVSYGSLTFRTGIEYASHCVNGPMSCAIYALFAYVFHSMVLDGTTEKVLRLQVAEVNCERECRKIGSGTQMIRCQNLGGMAQSKNNALRAFQLS